MPEERHRDPVRARPRRSRHEREWSAPYAPGAVTVSPRHELHTPEARPALREVLARIVEAEGPVHEDLLVQRAREAWGVGRAGSRIRDNVREVADSLVRSGKLVSADGFYALADTGTPKARHPADGDTPRKVVHIAPGERHVALYGLQPSAPA